VNYVVLTMLNKSTSTEKKGCSLSQSVLSIITIFKEDQAHMHR